MDDGDQRAHGELVRGAWAVRKVGRARLSGPRTAGGTRQALGADTPYLPSRRRGTRGGLAGTEHGAEGGGRAPDRAALRWPSVRRPGDGPDDRTPPDLALD